MQLGYLLELTDKVGNIEQRSHDRPLGRKAELRNQGARGDNAGRDPKAKDETGNNIRCHMVSKPLNEGSYDHHETATENGPPSPEPIVEYGNERQGDDGAEGVGSCNDAFEAALYVSLRVTKVLLIS